MTPELSDALADHMGIRRGEVHEVVSFYSFLQVPVTALRVCTGPICDSLGARTLAEGLEGALEVPCLGHCDLAPVATSGDTILPGHRDLPVTWSTNDGPSLELGRPDDGLADYERRGGLELLRDPPSLDRIVAELKASGLAGYGGALFPTGVKWEAVAREPGPRVVVVNADEGEPGTIKDRYVMELRPHLFLEATVLAMRALEAHEGYVYLREEYATARRRVGEALDELRTAGPAGRALARAGRRRRRVHRRRGDGDARVDGGPPGDAAAEAALPQPGGLPRRADADLERRDARARARDPADGGRRLGRARTWRRSRRAPLVGHGGGRAARLLRGAERDRAARADRGARVGLERGARRDRPGRRGERDPASRSARRAADARRARAVGRRRRLGRGAGVPARTTRRCAWSPRRCASSPRSRARSARPAASGRGRSTICWSGSSTARP